MKEYRTSTADGHLDALYDYIASVKHGHLSTKPFRTEMVLISNVTNSRVFPKFLEEPELYCRYAEEYQHKEKNHGRV